MTTRQHAHDHDIKALEAFTSASLSQTWSQKIHCPNPKPDHADNILRPTLKQGRIERNVCKKYIIFIHNVQMTVVQNQNAARVERTMKDLENDEFWKNLLTRRISK